MKPLKSIIRISALIVLSAFALALLFADEQGALTAAPIHKSVAAAILWVVTWLYKRWSRVDPVISAYDKYCEDAANGKK